MYFKPQPFKESPIEHLDTLSSVITTFGTILSDAKEKLPETAYNELIAKLGEIANNLKAEHDRRRAVTKISIDSYMRKKNLQNWYANQK
tara:strand:+ start:177 stop:443 length:267 start_codon:yes stop_codon:yes gene_type:complete